MACSVAVCTSSTTIQMRPSSPPSQQDYGRICSGQEDGHLSAQHVGKLFAAALPPR
jgi:hypothetical protein